MSDAVGYILENQSYKGLPPLLKRDLGLEIEDRLIRRYLPTEKKGQYLQVNIYGWGKEKRPEDVNPGRGQNQHFPP